MWQSRIRGVWQKAKFWLNREVSPAEWRSPDRLNIGAGEPDILLVSRARCLFRQLDLESVPEKKRESALQLKVMQISPFKRTGFHALWSGSKASVWLWDAGKLQALSSHHEFRHVLPEALYQMPPKGDGLRLLALSEGYEGQIWRNGVPAGSMYWHEAPDFSRWAEFLRGYGMAPQFDYVPEVIQPTRLSTAWSRPNADWLKALESREHYAWSALAFLVLAMIGWLAGAAGKIHYDIVQYQTQMNELSEQSEQVLASRSRALQNLQRIESIKALTPLPTQLSLLSTVKKALGQSENQLLDWRYSDERLQIEVNLSATQATDFIQALEQQPNLKVLDVSRGDKAEQLKVNLQVLPEYSAADGDST